MKQILVPANLSLSLVVSMLVPADSALAQESTKSWAERISPGADLRLRYDVIRDDGEDDRNLWRYRGRAGISAELSENLHAAFRLATGGDDPVSTNQNFGDGFRAEDIKVDLAYLTWKWHEAWRLTVGKMDKPWFRAGDTTLVWDNDLNPEGLVIAYANGRFFGSAGSFIAAERPDSDESRLNTVQAGVDLQVSENSAVVIAVSYFNYTNTVGEAPFYDNDPQGNTVDANGNYVFDYDEIEVGAQYRGNIGAWPITVFGEYLVNTAVGREDAAYTVGVTAGQAGKSRKLQFRYAWHDTDADALNATYHDSDLARGEADARGHYFRARYWLRDDIFLSGSFIFSEYGGFAGDERDFNRIMLDVQFEF